MLSYMLPTEEKPPAGTSHLEHHQESTASYRSLNNHHHSILRCPLAEPHQQNNNINNNHHNHHQNNHQIRVTRTSSNQSGMFTRHREDEQPPRPGSAAPLLPQQEQSPKHNGQAPTVRKSTLHTSKVTKDESLYSIDSDASTVGSDRKSKIINGPKHANLKRVSFGSSKGSMVETLVYETPVQEEPEINHFLESNGRLPAPMIPVPDTDTDSGWDNPFRPDGDLSREADEIVELIKGGKPITPTPGQNAPALPGCERKSATELDSSSSPLLDGTNLRTSNSSHQGNGNAHSTPIKPSNNQQAASEKNTATVEVGRVTAQGPGDASQVEHVTLKKKPKCKCCVLQ